jgi:hypothetical protein
MSVTSPHPRRWEKLYRAGDAAGGAGGGSIVCTWRSVMTAQRTPAAVAMQPVLPLRPDPCASCALQSREFVAPIAAFGRNNVATRGQQIRQAADRAQVHRDDRLAMAVQCGHAGIFAQSYRMKPARGALHG